MQEALKAAGHQQSGNRTAARLRHALVVVELSVSRLLTSQKRYYAETLARVQQLPMVRSVAISTDLPLTVDRPFSSMGFQVGGRPPVPMA